MKIIFFLTFIPILALLLSFDDEEFCHQRLTRTSVFDHGQLLTSSQEDSISLLIAQLEKKIGSQIGVVTITDLEGQTLEEFSIQTARKLKLGRSTHNDGLLITVVLADRQVRIEVGTGLESIIRDEIASRINREVMAPHFREGRFGLGLYVGVDSISQQIIGHKDMVGQEPRLK